MIPLPKGFKLPHGMSMESAQRAIAGASECSKLVEQLLKDPVHSNLIKLFILDNKDKYPVLSSSFEILTD